MQIIDKIFVVNRGEGGNRLFPSPFNVSAYLFVVMNKFIKVQSS